MGVDAPQTPNVARHLELELEGAGYPLKDRVSEPRAFADAVRKVGSGGAVLDPEVLAAIFGESPQDARLDLLSTREREVMERVASGRTLADIADDLHDAETAVEAVAESICRKLALPPLRDPRRRVLAVRA